MARMRSRQIATASASGCLRFTVQILPLVRTRSAAGGDGRGSAVIPKLAVSKGRRPTRRTARYFIVATPEIREERRCQRKQGGGEDKGEEAATTRGGRAQRGGGGGNGSLQTNFRYVPELHRAV